MMDIQRLMSGEASVISRMLEQNKIYARIDRKRSYVVNAGFLHYALTLRADQQFSAVERINRELSAALSALRRRAGLPDIQVLPVSTGGFALETPHPQPQVLHWSGRALVSNQPHTMLLGESYAGTKATETVSFDDAPHVLIAGITGSGKSVLMQHMLLSLTATTGPDALQIVLVDLKNEDLRPFAQLPHIQTFAGNREAAEQAIAAVVAEKERRIETNAKDYRLLLVIDELAQLASNKATVEALGDLASIGRSKAINLICATQHPTEKGGLGSLLKANFPLRLVGQVAPGQSYAATGRAGLHADLLPGKGAFLRLQGATVKRFQSFFIDGDDVVLMARKIGAHWSTSAPKTAPLPAVIQPAPTIKRDEIDDIADRIRELWQTGASKNAMAKAAGFKQYAGSYAAKVDEAIKRLMASTASTTEPSTTLLLSSTHTSEGQAVESSSRSDQKILRLPLRKAS